MKTVKQLLVSSILLTSLVAVADNDVHTGELSGNYSGVSHVDSVWKDTIANGAFEDITFSTKENPTDYTRADFSNADFLMVQFYNATMRSANFSNARFEMVSFRDSDLRNANFRGSRFMESDFMGSDVTNADFTDAVIGLGSSFLGVKGFTANQLYSTALYKAKDLSTIDFGDLDMAGWNLEYQNLSSTRWRYVNMEGAKIKGANFSEAVGFSKHHLYSTEDYRNGDLSDINFSNNDLNGWSFSGINLTNTTFTNTEVKNADFSFTTSKGFTAQHLYSTSSYANKDLTGILLCGNDLTNWSFQSQNLASVNFTGSILVNTDFTDSDTTNANFSNTIKNGLTQKQLESASNGL